jgi:hypothetical protein
MPDITAPMVDRTVNFAFFIFSTTSWFVKRLRIKMGDLQEKLIVSSLGPAHEANRFPSPPERPLQEKPFQERAEMTSSLMSA